MRQAHGVDEAVLAGDDEHARAPLVERLLRGLDPVPADARAHPADEEACRLRAQVEDLRCLACEEDDFRCRGGVAARELGLVDDGGVDAARAVDARDDVVHLGLRGEAGEPEGAVFRIGYVGRHVALVPGAVVEPGEVGLELGALLELGGR